MTTQEAKIIGNNTASEILKDGDFTITERLDEDLFCTAFSEIVENRQQYDDFSFLAATINNDENSESLWEAYEAGIDETLNQYIEKTFNS